MAVKIEVQVFWVVTLYSGAIGPCCLHHPEDGGSKVLRNAGIHHTTRCNNLENHELYLERCENLKCLNVTFISDYAPCRID